ncbi:hypothetical protein LTR10_004476 [Elasticomyces elasticus]|nr:hypothetical protein LTR10_004476 [Elasticomyces elasticus]KAK4976795.1 hypothetical protein LTR42_002840 [Elasticomyces elasticus]
METENIGDGISGDAGARHAPDQSVDESHAVSVPVNTTRPSTEQQLSYETLTQVEARRPSVSLDRSVRAETSGGHYIPGLSTPLREQLSAELKAHLAQERQNSPLPIPLEVQTTAEQSEQHAHTRAHEIEARLEADARQRALVANYGIEYALGLPFIPLEQPRRPSSNPPPLMMPGSSQSSLSLGERERRRLRRNPHETHEDSRPQDQAFQDGLETPPRQPNVEPFLNETREEKQLRQLYDAGNSVVFDTAHSRGDQNVPKTSTLNIAALQQMNLHYLQYRIARHVGRSFDASTFVPYIDSVDPQYFEPDLPDESGLHYWMEQHCQAVRDKDYMRERATLNPSEGPFKMMSSRAVERSIMDTVGLIPKHLIPAGILPNALDHEEPALHINSRVKAKKEEAREQNLQRLAMAAIGGLLLLLPVLIMANLPGKLATLVTTSASMVVFAVLVTMGTDLGPNEVLATTAGYAAVLVVFVGTSLAPQAGNSC